MGGQIEDKITFFSLPDVCMEKDVERITSLNKNGKLEKVRMVGRNNILKCGLKLKRNRDATFPTFS